MRPVRISLPVRTSVERGSCSSERLAVTNEKAGIASANRMAAEPAAASSGRRITRCDQRIQNPSRPAAFRRAGTRRLLIRGPSSESTAGSRVIAASTATATTMIAASAIDCTARTGTIQIEASETTTVMPEKATAVPDVLMARATATSVAAPAASSWRNRARMNIE
jgi:hypothetical protein